MVDRKLSVVRRIASQKGISGTIDISSRENKRFKIVRLDGKTIHFGVWPYSRYGTFIDHRDPDIREAWRARHSKIMKDGKPAYKNKDSPAFYAWNLLW
jgi:hypothetical protein